MFLRLTSGCGSGFLTLLLIGCAGNGFAPAHGKLIYPDGSPVTDMKNAQVVFEGVGANGKGYSAAGTIDAEGKFVLTSERPGDGAVPGKNKVLIAPYVPDPERPPPKILDPKFEKFETSGLEAEVKTSGSNEFTFTVERIKPLEPKKDTKK
jgi:hypothetical protein